MCVVCLTTVGVVTVVKKLRSSRSKGRSPKLRRVPVLKPFQNCEPSPLPDYAALKTRPRTPLPATEVRA